MSLLGSVDALGAFSQMVRWQPAAGGERSLRTVVNVSSHDHWGAEVRASDRTLLVAACDAATLAAGDGIVLCNTAYHVRDVATLEGGTLLQVTCEPA